MSYHNPRMSDRHLQLAVFRLNDMCVSVQEGMDRYLSTAALEKMPGVEATFGWLRKRGVRICLLSDYGRNDTQLLLRRLGWTVDENGTVQTIITRQQRKENPVLMAQEEAGLDCPGACIAALDTPRLLQQACAARVHFNLAICNGRHTYHELAVAPHHAMLDSLIQLPNFLLQHLPAEGTNPSVKRRGSGFALPRLRLPRPLSRR